MVHSHVVESTTCLTGNAHAFLQSEGFYVSDRRMSNGQPSISARDGGGASYGLPRPIQLPTARELELDSSGFVSTINRLTSPVFYSTRPDGQIVKGLSGVPVQQRPVLLIGNHQFFAGAVSELSGQLRVTFTLHPAACAQKLGASDWLVLAKE